ncbi:DgyrCDS5332 [Dimorphilus gyrociliatus]|uniref:DgyrCDS5332 n=1 Tax=Dimorphilus gyrociliatus TaxID=2664684 RepID=A0A7I8VJJ9_9ANNE|nr:DgyrCDS5332 [Dimorphilus gyrociliatus]
MATHFESNCVWLISPATKCIHLHNENNQRKAIICNLFKPKSLIVDYKFYRLIWVEENTIKTSTLTGSDIKVLFQAESEIRGLALDYSDDSLYFSVDEKIRSLSNNITFHVKEGWNVTDMAFYGNLLAVAVKTTAARGLIVFIDKRTGRVLREHSKENVKGFGSLSIFNYNGWRSDNISSARSCPCQHICVPSFDSFECVCQDGYQTNPENGNKCSPNTFNDTSYLLIADDYKNAIYKISLDFKKYSPVLNLQPTFTRPVGLTYDLRNKRIFYYDLSYGYLRIYYENGTVTSIRQQFTLYMEYDIFSDLLITNEGRRLTLSSTDGRYKKVLYSRTTVRQLSIEYKSRKIYFVTYAEIYNINFDGTELKLLRKGNFGYPLALDEKEGRLYFNNFMDKSISSIKTDGSDYKFISEAFDSWMLFSIIVVDEYIYFTNWRVRGIGKALKSGGLNNTHELLRQDVFSMMNQVIVVNSSNNPGRLECPVGICEQLCVISNCLCSDGYQLYNETNCKLVPKPTLPSTPSLPSTTTKWQNDRRDQLSTAELVGIIVGIAIALILIIIAVVLFKKYSDKYLYQNLRFWQRRRMSKIEPTKFRFETQLSVSTHVSEDELLSTLSDSGVFTSSDFSNEVAQPVRRSSSRPSFERHLSYISQDMSEP